MAASWVLLLMVTASMLLLTTAAWAHNASGGAAETAPPGHLERIYCALGLIFFVWILVYGSLVPLEYQFAMQRVGEAARAFGDMLTRPIVIASRADLVVNILVAVPIGFFGTGTLRLQRSRHGRIAAPSLAMLLCVMLSLGVEFAQIWNPFRYPTSLDILAQTGGAAIGGASWLLLERPSVTALRRLPDPARWSCLDWALGLYLVWLTFRHLRPLDLTMSLHLLWHKYQMGGISPLPFVDLRLGFITPSQLVWDVAMFVPVGVAVAVGNLPSPQVRSWRRGLLMGLAIAAGLELAQVFIYSRWATGTDVFTALTGVAIGIAIARRIRGFR